MANPRRLITFERCKNSIPRPWVILRCLLSRPIWLLAGGLAVLLLGLGCDRRSRSLDPREDQVFAAIRAQVKALNQRDAEGALAMMHPEAPGFDRTRETMKQVTAAYDLIYMLQNLTLVSADENEAQVRFTQVTQKISGPEFRNNRVVGIHTLRKYQGAWKIYYTQVLSINEL